MTRKAGKPKPRAKLYKRDLTDPETLGLVNDLMPVGDDAEPIAAHVWVDGRNRPRRIKVGYPNGWVVTIGIGLDGKVSSRSAMLKLVTRIVRPTAEEPVPA